MVFTRDFDIEKDYFDWLCNLVEIDQGTRSYRMLAKDLHMQDFYYSLERDKNRAADGLDLRNDYLREVGFRGEVDWNKECSVLEMIVALAMRMDFETGDPNDFESSHSMTSYWFWEMIDNLNLLEFTDESYDGYGWDLEVDATVIRMLDRRYREDGEGGLFPLADPEEDQRDVEIWYQMAAYLGEKGC